MRAVLEQHYGVDAPFLQQTQDGVEVFVHRCIQQLGGPMPTNSMPISSGSDYRMRARTAQEIKDTIAAESGSVTAAPRQFRVDDPIETIDKRGELADPMAGMQPKIQVTPVRKPDEWAL